MKKKPISKPTNLVKKRKKVEMLNYEYYSLRSILGYVWAMFIFLLGGREAGKSYAVTKLFVHQFLKYGRPFYWLRLSETSMRKLLMNNAENLVDPDIRRLYHLDLVTNGNCVYMVTRRSEPDKNGKTRILEKKLMARVLCLATYYNDKGSGLFDKDFLNDPNMYYNICLDEMNREPNEKNSFDIVYSFANQIENLIRSTKKRVRIICIGNTLQEASDILSTFEFIPEDFGRYKLRKKRAVIDYIPLTEKYKQRREGTAASILAPTASTFTNEIKVDKTLVNKKRLTRPTAIISFGKGDNDKFTLWDDSVIAKYHHEHVRDIAMRPYLDLPFQVDIRDNIIQRFDLRNFTYRDLVTFKLFQKQVELLKPRK